MSYVLAADVSGTHTRIFIFDTEEFSIFNLEEFATQEVSDFSLLLQEYLERVDCSCGTFVLACAGKVAHRKVSLANSSLEIDAHILEKEFDVDVVLLNDFEAISCGVLRVDEKRLCEILPSLHRSTRQLFVGAGTGFGCGVFSDNGVFENTEAGHFMVEKTGLVSNELLEFACEYYNEEEIEIEDIISGSGLEMLNKYFTGKYLRAEDVEDKNVLKEFFKIYARVINYLSEKYDCSFVYVAGGIVGKRYHDMNEHNFTQYLDHHLGVTLVLDYDVSLYGLIEYYKSRLS